MKYAALKYLLGAAMSFVLVVNCLGFAKLILLYRNDPKVSDRQVWENSADFNQTALRGAV